jgi:hypothetical protein
LAGIPRLSAFAQADMAITNAAAGDFIIRKKRNKESVERAAARTYRRLRSACKKRICFRFDAKRTMFHISAFRFQLCAFDLQSRPAKIEA